MNIEESRFRTFSGWPSDAAIDPARIAKAGFYYTGQGLEVQCFSCGGKISEWNYGDQVMARHRRLDPHCPFVVNPLTSGNIPKLIASSDDVFPEPIQNPLAVESDPQYRNESCRLRTYVNWPVPHIVSPDTLVKAGFYSLQQGDKVRCAFCNGVLGLWQSGDNPRTEHIRHFPQCIFVYADFNPSLNTADSSIEATVPPADSNSKLVSSSNLHELGIQTHKSPKNSRYSTLESRQRTYGEWPPDLIQTPDVLAEAGFYYVGAGDQVRCFHCDGGLRHWDPQDVPWVEHARWFPKCPFVQLVKGQEFIHACKPEPGCQSNRTQEPSPVNLPSRSVPSTRVREVTEQELQTYMNQPQALAALSIGLHVGRVKQAIRQKVEQTGLNYATADALIEAALGIQHEENDSDSTDTEISEEVSRILSTVLTQIKLTDNGEQESGVSATDNREPPRRIEASSAQLSLEEENRQLREARLCKICMDSEIGVVFLPCGHLTTCVNCALSLKDCPVCRSAIKATVRTFLS